MFRAYRDCIIQWLSRILNADVSLEDIRHGSVFVDLVNLTGEIHISGDIRNTEIFEQLMSFLDGNYHVNVSELFPRAIASTETTDDIEAFGLCLVVLIACLQSRAKQLFMDAALDLDMETQTLIFRLLREPMSQLSSDQPLTRELILSVFIDQGPPELQLPEIGDVETTPIKLAEHGIHARQSWCGSFDGRTSPKYSNFSDVLQQGRAAFTGCSSPIDFAQEKASVAGVFRAPTAVCPRKRKTEHLENNNLSEFNRELPSVEQHNEICTITPHCVDERLGKPCIHSDSSCPTSPLASRAHSNMALHEKQKFRRPTDLPLQQLTSTFQSSKQNSFSGSRTADFVDFLDLSVAPRSVPPPLASPLASLQHILDSPLWTQKTRLREMERDRRRLVAELEKEHAFRYEMEALVPELRSQLDEARIRMTEAEAKAARLTRDLAALQDQADELNVCRTELALREDEITNLKQRLNSFQDLLSHSRKLEQENSHLRNECADHCQKIEQLSAKLSDVKDRQLVYAEVETLRSKLRDAEAQLAQLLADSEKTEKDARRQHELYNQLKLQQSLAEVRRAANKRHSQNGTVTSTHVFDGKTVSGNSLNDFECEEILSTPNGGIGSVGDTTPTPNTDAIPLRTGENLGSVLESELHMAHSKISRLQAELEDALGNVSARDTKITQLVGRLDQLTGDLTTISIQCKLAEETANQARDCLESLQDDFATLEGRLLLFHPSRCDAESTGTDASAGNLLERFRNICTGLSEPLDRIFRLLFDRLSEASQSQFSELSAVRSLLSEAELRIQKLDDEVKQKDSALMAARTSLDEHKAKSADMSASLRAAMVELEQEKVSLQSQVQSGQELSQRLEMRVLELETELYNTDKTEFGVQTDDCLAQFPLVLAESLERLDMDEGEEPSPNIQDREPSPHPTQESTLQALTADRRGLSNELVRLHDELAESHVYAQQLTEQNADLMEKLAFTESELQHQMALLTQAQQKWVLMERKDRETEERIKQLQAEHTAQLESLRTECLAHTRCASQVERLQAKHAIEKKEMKRQLNEAKNEVQKMETDRAHLVERNQDLQRELITTQTLIETIIRSQDLPPMRSSLNQAPAKNVNGLLEEWIETSRRLSSHHSAAPDTNDAFSDCSDYSCESDGSRPSVSANHRPSLNGFHTDHCASERGNTANGSQPSGDRQPSHSIVDEIARLSTRTAMLESFALALSRHKDPVTQSTVNAQKPDKTAGVPLVRGKSRLSATRGAVTTAPPPTATVQPAAELHDLDTDADSSAYTDLSQVSPVSRNSPHLGSSGRSAAVHSSPILRRNSQVSQALQQSDPVHRKTHPRLSVGNNDTRSPSCNNSPSDGGKTKTEDDSKFIDPNRIHELHRRNRLQPSHLRSSYPVETQAVEPVHLISALHQLSAKRETTEQAQHYRQLSEPSKFSTGHGSILREVDEDNLSQLSTLGASVNYPEKHRKTQLKSITNCFSPRAAGYQPKPQNLQELTDAFIAASHDSSMLIDELSSQLKRSALTTPIPSASTNSSCLPSRLDSARPNPKESSSVRVQRTIDQTRHRPKSFFCVDENVNPPPIPTESNGKPSTRQRFRRPANPPQPTESTSTLDRHRHSSGDSLASSTQSIPSSIAFEIPIDRPAKKPGRLPVPRPPRICTAPTVQQSQTRKQTSAKLPVASHPMPMLPSDDSFRALATPIERNHRIVP